MKFSVAKRPGQTHEIFREFDMYVDGDGDVVVTVDGVKVLFFASLTGEIYRYYFYDDEGHPKLEGFKFQANQLALGD